jgi:Protein tyrosine phosphatase-like protein, PTPLA
LLDTIRVVSYFDGRTAGPEPLSSLSPLLCDDVRRSTSLALWISLVEVFNCVAGFTRSPLPAVLLFSFTRLGVENIVGPLLPCTSWQHLLTVFSWSLGDTIRFGSFAINTMDPTVTLAKSVRFTIGPILFPLGAFGEMMMVVLVASRGRPAVYVAAALWPVFFYPMMRQLLAQRRKHFQPKGKKEVKAI